MLSLNGPSRIYLEMYYSSFNNYVNNRLVTSLMCSFACSAVHSQTNTDYRVFVVPIPGKIVDVMYYTKNESAILNSLFAISGNSYINSSIEKYVQEAYARNTNIFNKEGYISDEYFKSQVTWFICQDYKKIIPTAIKMWQNDVVFNDISLMNWLDYILKKRNFVYQFVVIKVPATKDVKLVPPIEILYEPLDILFKSHDIDDNFVINFDKKLSNYLYYPILNNENQYGFLSGNPVFSNFIEHPVLISYGFDDTELSIANHLKKVTYLGNNKPTTIKEYIGYFMNTGLFKNSDVIIPHLNIEQLSDYCSIRFMETLYKASVDRIDNDPDYKYITPVMTNDLWLQVHNYLDSGYLMVDLS